MTFKETLTEIAALMRPEHEWGPGAREIAALLRYVLGEHVEAGDDMPWSVSLVGEEGATSIELELRDGSTVSYPYTERTAP